MTDRTPGLPEGLAQFVEYEELRRRFNDAVGQVRLLALLSPTCPVCLEGANTVASVIESSLAPAVVTSVVWLPVLDGDDRPAAVVAAARFAPGAIHHWDRDRRVSDQVQTLLDLQRWRRTLAWDLYLVFDRLASWGDRAPRPTAWFHQLGIDGVPALDPTVLRDALAAR